MPVAARSLPLVWVVIPAWNGCEDTIECLRSLENQTWPEYRVTLVDNGYTDGTSRMVREHFGWVDVLSLDRNLGFVGGSNAGIRRALDAGAHSVLLLNNDTVAPPDLLASLSVALQRNPDAGIVSPVIDFCDGQGSPWFSFGRIDFRTGLLSFNEDRKRLRGSRQDGLWESEWVPLCASLVRAEVLRDVGLLDPSYFGLYDDCDFSVRARARGWRILVDPNTHILHKVSRSYGSSTSPLYSYYVVRNRLYFLSKVGRRRTAWKWALRISAGAPLLALRAACRRRSSEVTAQLCTLCGILAFLRREMGQAPHWISTLGSR